MRKQKHEEVKLPEVEPRFEPRQLGFRAYALIHDFGSEQTDGDTCLNTCFLFLYFSYSHDSYNLESEKVDFMFLLFLFGWNMTYMELY